MSDTDATQVRQDVVADVDEILEHVINGNMLSMPYDVYIELFDAVDGLGVKLENLQSENTKLRELVSDLMPVVCEGCHERLCEMPKEEHPFVECLFDCCMRELGIEVGE